MTGKHIHGRPGATTVIVGLIGWPVSHSVSPAMHNAAFSAAGLDWRYIPLPVATAPTERIGEAIRGIAALGFRGANVTVPHKQAVMPYVDRITPAAQAIGAVNTLVVGPAGSLLGDNTDAQGFVADLQDHQVQVSGRHALILGAGGSARAVVYGLAEAGCARIAIANRTRERSEALANAMQERFSKVTVTGHSLDGLDALSASAHVVVNCTSVGMTPDVNGMPWPDDLKFRRDQIVYDLVYNPRQTRLLKTAVAAGAQAIGGLGMLVWQGAIAFELWTGVRPSVEVMRAAAENAMSHISQPADR